MRHHSVRIAGILTLGLALVLLAGCAEKSPEQQLVEARANYTATLGGWSVLEPIAAEPEPMLEDEVMDDVAADEGSPSETEPTEEAEPLDEEAMPETPLEEAQPALKAVLLDILIRNENQTNLPGITLDISQANEAGDEMRHWRIFVDTSSIGRGPGTLIDHRLEGVEIVEGYGFHVEVRSPVATEDRGDYREFDDLP